MYLLSSSPTCSSFSLISFSQSNSTGFQIENWPKIEAIEAKAKKIKWLTLNPNGHLPLRVSFRNFQHQLCLLLSLCSCSLPLVILFLIQFLLLFFVTPSNSSSFCLSSSFHSPYTSYSFSTSPFSSSPYCYLS